MATGRVPTTANSPLTAKGDLFTYSTAPARLAVGNDGETIVADSSTATGLRYQGSMAAGKNAFINGGFDIWQRGTSINASASGTPYAADRWTIYSGNTGTVTRQATGDTTNLPNIQYCARVQRTAGGTGTGAFYFGQSIETINSIPYAGKTIAYSFYARAGANFSGILTGNFLASTGTDQNYVTGAITGQTTVITTGNIALTTTWQRFTFTGTVPTNATQIGQFFYSTATGTAGAADYYEITGVQVELGSVATAFARNAGTIQGETSACQRYYYRTGAGDIYSGYGNGVGKSTTTAYILVNFPQTMRTIPSSTIDGTGTLSNYALYDGTNVTAATALAADRPQVDNYSITVTVASGLTQYRPYVLINNNTSAAFLGFSAEL